MKNRDKYAEELLNVACTGKKIAIDKRTMQIRSCTGLSCGHCLFGKADYCNEEMAKWAESEYIEQPKISKKDRAFLDYLKDYKYMARDKNGDLYAYTTIPIRTTTYWRGATCKNLCSLDIYFPMVKWSD
jgi:hypothetical protein